MAPMMAACVAWESARTRMFSGGNSNFPIRSCRISSTSLSDPASVEILSEYLYLLIPTRRANLVGVCAEVVRDQEDNRAAARSGGIVFSRGLPEMRPVSPVQENTDRITGSSKTLCFLMFIVRSYTTQPLIV